jgi:hypothetical protein
MKTPNPAVARVLKRLHYPLDVILTCVRWYVAYSLSLRNLEEMMAARHVGGLFNRASLRHQAAAGAGKSVSLPQAPCWQELALRRDLQYAQPT